MPLSQDQKGFIQEYSMLLQPWGMPINMGRVFAYLLLQKEPVSLEEIAANLELSKTSAWNMTRDLTQFGHAKRHSVAGSKQALFAISSDYTTPLLKQNELLKNIGQLLQQQAKLTGDKEHAKDLRTRGAFYKTVQETLNKTIESLNRIS